MRGERLLFSRSMVLGSPIFMPGFDYDSCVVFLFGGLVKSGNPFVAWICLELDLNHWLLLRAISFPLDS